MKYHDMLVDACLVYDSTIEHTYIFAQSPSYSKLRLLDIPYRSWKTQLRLRFLFTRRAQIGVQFCVFLASFLPFFVRSAILHNSLSFWAIRSLVAKSIFCRFLKRFRRPFGKLFQGGIIPKNVK